ncbi:hypothetical protein ABVT39_001859 [Epinephelus coioides]
MMSAVVCYWPPCNSCAAAKRLQMEKTEAGKKEFMLPSGPPQTREITREQIADDVDRGMKRSTGNGER